MQSKLPDLPGLPDLPDDILVKIAPSMSDIISLNKRFRKLVEEHATAAKVHKNFSGSMSFPNSISTASLVGFSSLKSLTLDEFYHGNVCWKDLNKLSSLTHLQCSCTSSLRSLNDFSGMTHLKSLNFSKCHSLKDIQTLSQLTLLTHLDLSSCSLITDIAPLGSLENLVSLDLENLEGLDTSVPALGKLEILYLRGCKYTILLDLAGANPGLKTLDISYVDNESLDYVPSPQIFQGFTALETLVCLRTKTMLPNLTCLANSLLNLDLTGNYWDNLARLTGLTNLKNLFLGDRAQMRIDTRHLVHLTSLEILDLSMTTANDLTPLSHLRRLEVLTIRHCPEIRSLEPLRGLEKLKYINCSGCYRLKDLTPLTTLPSLTTVKCNKCPKLDGVQKVLKMPGVDLENEWS